MEQKTILVMSRGRPCSPAQSTLLAASSAAENDRDRHLVIRDLPDTIWCFDQELVTDAKRHAAKRHVARGLMHSVSRETSSTAFKPETQTLNSETPNDFIHVSSSYVRYVSLDFISISSLLSPPKPDVPTGADLVGPTSPVARSPRRPRRASACAASARRVRSTSGPVLVQHVRERERGEVVDERGEVDEVGVFFCVCVCFMMILHVFGSVILKLMPSAVFR